MYFSSQGIALRVDVQAESAQIDSAFQLTEHLKALHYSYTHPASSDTTRPISRSMANSLATPPPGIDRSLWLYELCRVLVQKVNTIIVALFTDTPPCSALTCSEMRASEWQYLCAVHDPPKSCCAIDYCCHTLDWAANTLTNPKHFPSRLTLSGGTGEGTSATSSQHQVRQLSNVIRRVYRIFAHAWFSHREVFWRVEGKTGLYVFYKTVCDTYNLIPEENYTVPAEAEGIEQAVETPSATRPAPSAILKRSSIVGGSEGEMTIEKEGSSSGANLDVTPGATAKRHRHTPSKGVSPVATVIEENEDEDVGQEQPELLTPRKPAQPTSRTDETNLQDHECNLHSSEGDETETGDPLTMPNVDCTADEEDDLTLQEVETTIHAVEVDVPSISEPGLTEAEDQSRAMSFADDPDAAKRPMEA